jgi:predicted GNAT family N-acyltransferase
MSLRVEHLVPGTDLSAAFRIRKQAFNGQDGVSIVDDVDSRDDKAEHFMAYDDAQEIGTARYIRVTERVGKVEYLAVLPEYSDQDVDAALLEAIQEAIRYQGVTQLVLEAEVRRANIFACLGYHVTGEVYEDTASGLSFIKMAKSLSEE